MHPVSTLCRTFAVFAATVSILVLGVSAAHAQAPVVLPYTISTIAGTPGAVSASVGIGNYCSGTSGPKATSAYNDGCPASQAIFNTGTPSGGVAIDQAGDVYVADTSNQVIHRIDARTGIMTLVAGNPSSSVATSPCSAASGAADKYGDGCPLANAGQFNNPRGIGYDPFGNILIAGYSDYTIHQICNNVSPTCTSAKLGTMQLVAGCTAPSTAGNASNTNSGKAVTSPTDNTLPYLVTSTTTGCSSTGIGLNQPRGANGDSFGNIYIGDTANTRYRVVLGPQTYNGVTNPLWAMLTITGSPYSTLTAGYIYGLAGTSATGFSAKGASVSCSAGGGTTNTSADADGDNCPFYNAGLTLAGSGGAQAIQADAHGNVFFGDKNLLRVIYAGNTGNATVKAAIMANNGGVAPLTGYTYVLSGSTVNTTIATYTVPQLGSSVAGSSFYHMQVDKAGNIFFGDNSSNVEFYDMQTGFIRELSVGAGTLCTASTSASGTAPNSVGDGCPAINASVSSSNSFGIALDQLGNVFVNDLAHQLIRKISATTFPNVATGTAYTPSIFVHAAPGTTGFTTAFQLNSSFALGTGTCKTNLSTSNPAGDNTYDCVYPVTIAPNGAGLRESGLTVTSAGTYTAPYTAGTLGTGLNTTNAASVLTFDPSSTPASVSTVVAATVNTVATDASNNSFFGNANGIYRNGTSIAVPTAAPVALTVDQPGNVYYTTGSGAQIYKLSAQGYGQSTLATTGYVPGALASDPSGNLYFYDGTSKQIFRFIPSVQSFTALTTTAFTTVTAINLDPNGNLVIADSGAGKVYRLPNTGGTQTAVPVTGSILPTGVATDASNDIYIADSANNSGRHIVFVPVTGTQSNLASASASVAGVAVDGLGNVLVADALGSATTSITNYAIASNVATFTANNTYFAGQSVTLSGFSTGTYFNGQTVTVLAAGLTATQFQASFTNPDVASTADNGTGTTQTGGGTSLNRSSVSYFFPTSASMLTGTVSDAGNAASTAFTQSNTTNFTLFNTTSAPAATCTASTSLAPGAGCTINATVGGGGTNVSGTLLLTPTTNTFGVLNLSALLSGTVTVSTTTTVGNQTPANPTYAATGSEVAFTLAVTANSGTAPPTGNVTYQIDSAAAQSVALAPGSGTGSTANVTLAGIAVGTHTITASYPTTGGFTASASSPLSFTIAQATPTITWTPFTTTQQYSVALGTNVLNAVATNPSNGQTIPGTFVYTATTGGVTTVVDSASYLAINSAYTLATTFYPTDSINYASGTNQTLGNTYSVTRASTIGSIAGSTLVVAPSGTAYTSVESAVTALGAAGGNIYLAPGTYTEQVLVNVPNVQIHGLGGNAAAVNLTYEAGAFSTANSFGFNNDGGAATLLVAPKNTTPKNFYMDYLTVTNTYDTDNANTNGIQSASNGNGTCTGSTTSSNFSLFTANHLCGSQAIALYITADKSVLNNVRLVSLQDTLATFNVANNYPSCTAGTSCTSRQYYWKNYITGDVDYVFGDSAAVFDQSTFYTQYHYGVSTGQANIFAQSKGVANGAGNDYLSGFVANNTSFTSESDAGAMSAFYFGRPLGNTVSYSTTALINSTVDDVIAAGYSNGNPALASTDSYYEFGTVCTTGNCSTTGRETTTAQPVVQTLPFITQYAPTNFLGTTTLAPDVWNPTGALTTGINGYIPAAPVTSIAAGSSYTILARPNVPGGGFVPTGNYTLTMDGVSIVGSPASLTGTLDASGAAYGILPASMLPPGTHTFTFTYAGDANFSASSQGSFSLNVVGTAQSINFPQPTSPAGSGSSATLTATASSSLPVTYSIMSGPATINGSTVTYTGPGTVVIAANQPGNGTYAAAPTVTRSVTVYAATFTSLTVTGIASTSHNGLAQTAVVTAYDQNGSVFGGFTGSVTLTSTDPLANLNPVTYTFQPSDNGVHTFSVTFGTAGTQTVTATSGGISGSESNIAVDDVFFVINSNGTVARFAENGTGLSTGSGGGAPTTAAAFDAAGNLFSLNPASNLLAEFSRASVALSGSGFAGGGLSTPNLLAVDGLGQVWITNNNGSISLFSNAGTALSPGAGFSGAYTSGGVTTKAFNAPTGVGIDQAGNVWIANSGNNTVTEVLGAAAPSAPLATAVTSNTTGARP